MKKSKKIIYRNSFGEYFPYDEADILLLQCCKNYNKKLRAAISFVEMAKDISLSPIQSNLKGEYFPLKSHSKFFREWCDYQNKMHRLKRLEEKETLCDEEE